MDDDDDDSASTTSSSPSVTERVLRKKDEEDEMKKEVIPPWDVLPHVALLNVFRYLPERDRLRAQLACRRWYHVIRGSACLWRDRSFRFSGRDPKDLTHGPYRFATHFVRVFGRYLRRLEFRLYSPISSGVCKKFQKAVKVALVNMTRKSTQHRLVELSLPLLQLDRAQWMLYREDLCNVLARFFCQGRKTVERIYLRGARASWDDGYKVLYALSYSAGHVVRELDIEDFFTSGRQPIHEIRQFRDCFINMRQLREINLNYSYVSDDLLTVLANNLDRDALEYFFIKVSVHEDRGQIVPGWAWQRLRDQCPGMRVEMLFQRVMTFSDHFRILSPEIPLARLTFDGCYFADREWQMLPTISSILPYYRDTLERIYLDVPDTRELFEYELLTFMQQCSRLKHIKINAFITPRFLRNLLLSKQEGKCCFETLKMRIYVQNYDTTGEDREVDSIYNEFKHLIRDKLDDYYAVCCVSI